MEENRYRDEGSGETNNRSIAPREAIKDFLEKAISTSGGSSSAAKGAEAIVSSLQSLHEAALERINSLGREKGISRSEDRIGGNFPESAAPTVRIPSTKDKAERGLFHRAFKVEFPLLRAQTVRRNADASTTPEDVEEAPFMEASIDVKYDQLIPFLLEPAVDLLGLFAFEKRGFEEVNETGAEPRNDFVENGQQQRTSSGNKRKRRDRGRGTDTASRGRAALLRLKPCFSSKDDRRSVHQILSSRSKFFDTSTVDNVPLQGVDAGQNFECKNISRLPEQQGFLTNAVAAGEATTVAVAVSWQRRMILKSKKKKRRRGRTNSERNHRDYSSLLCVLMKRGR